MIEEWKPIPDFSDYAVSNHGRIKRIISKRNWGIKIKSQHDSKYGYPQVWLRKDMKTFVYHVHKLVMRVFIGEPPFKCEVNHKDGNKHNNCLLNLEYLTKGENHKHAYKLGLRKCYYGNAKLKPEEVNKIRNLKNNNLHQKDIAKIFNISSSTVNLILNNKIWKQIPMFLETPLDTYPVQIGTCGRSGIGT